MSEGEKKKDEKKNTDAWKLKQEQKKRKKEAEQTNAQATKDNYENEGKKAELKKEKIKGKKEQKVEVKESKEIQATAEVSSTLVVQNLPIIYKRLIKIDDNTTGKQRQISRKYQCQLVFKYLDQYIAKNDIILYVGKQYWTPNCQQVHIPDFNNSKNAELICNYSDITYFFEAGIAKIFIEGLYIFANGSLFAKKGSLNLVLLAEYYQIPVVGFGGSWNYNGWYPLSESSLLDHFGQSVLGEYDWIEAKYLKSLILEVGSINPKQVSTYPPIIYKNMNIQAIDW